MSQTIQVYKNHSTTVLLGTGTGEIAKATATIDAWKKGEQAGLQAGTSYNLKAASRWYPATCSAVGLPATFALQEAEDLRQEAWAHAQHA